MEMAKGGIPMDTESYTRLEQLLQLGQILSAVEEDRAAGQIGCTLDALDTYLDDVIKKS